MSVQAAPAAPPVRRLVPTWPFVWRMIRYAPGIFVLQSIAQIFYLGVRVLPGLIEKAIFDAITAAAPAGADGMAMTSAATGMVVPAVATLVAIYFSIGLARMVATYGETWAGYTFRQVTGAKLRHNLMAARLRQPGAVTPPMPAGEAVNRYNDDVDEVCDFPLWLPDVAGNLLSFVIAVAIMAAINWVITLFVFLPLAVAFVAGRLAWTRYLAYGHAAGRADDAARGFLGEIFAAVQAVKVAGAEESVTRRFAELSENRTAVAVRLNMLSNVLGTIYQLAVTAGIGVMLLLASQAMLSGSFTVGDFALFTYYLWFTTDLPSYLGTFVGDIKQQEVAIERLVELIPDEQPEALIAAPSSPAWGRTDRRPHLPTAGCADGARADQPLQRNKPRSPRSRPRSAGRFLYRHHGTDRGRQVDLAAGAAGAAAPRRRSSMLERRGDRRSGGMVPPAVLCLHAAGAAPVQHDAAREHLAGAARRRAAAAGSRVAVGIGGGREHSWSAAWTRRWGRAACACPGARCSEQRLRACWCAPRSCWYATTSRVHWTSKPSSCCGRE